MTDTTRARSLADVLLHRLGDGEAITETTRYDVPTVVWSYTAKGEEGEAPALLRRIADDLEADDAVLIGLWSTGFGKPDELVVQVVVDPDEQREAVTS